MEGPGYTCFMLRELSWKSVNKARQIGALKITSRALPLNDLYHPGEINTFMEQCLEKRNIEVNVKPSIQNRSLSEIILDQNVKNVPCSN